MKNILLLPFLIAALLLSACTPAAGAPVPAVSNNLVLYSGRSENLAGPLIEQYQEASGARVDVRWGGSSELAAVLLEEGEKSPADLFYSQEPGALGATLDMLAPLPDDILERVDERFRDPEGRWVGVSGRARVVVYNTQALSPADLPADIWDFSDPRWKGRLGWSPTNASFQTMVTAMRVAWGEEKTRRWLESMAANQPVAYSSNAPIVAAVGAGEVEAGFVNHYYLYRFLEEEGPGFAARNYFLPGGGPGSLVMVSGAGVLKTAANPEAAHEFLRFLLSPTAQQYFADQTVEYPLIEGIALHPDLLPLSGLHSIAINPADLADLSGTLDLLHETGVLP